MTIFLGFLVLFATVLELLSLQDGLKHIRFDYEPQILQAEPGEQIPVQIQLTNTGVLPVTDLKVEVSFPLWAQFEPGVPVREGQDETILTTNFRLWGRKQVSKTIPMRIMKRGIHFLKGAYLYRGDFLGLHHVPGEHIAHKEVLVYPQYLNNSGLLDALGSYCGDVIAQRHLIRDPIFTVGVREYTGREAMKTISWSQTARRGQLMTREFDYTRDFSCVVLLATDELHPKEVHLLDTSCAMVRTVCQELTDRGVNVDFYTNGARWSWKRDSRRIWNCTVENGRMQALLECLARLYVSTRCPAEELATTALRSAGMGMAFVLVVPKRTESMERAVQLLQERSGMKTLLLVAEEYEDV